jgi:phosphoesterase RecJ-like protein
MLKKIADEIKNKESFLISTHLNPDGDAIGSELALGICLANLGKEATIFNQNNTPRIYRFLPHSEKIVHQIDNSRDYDLVFIVDCSDLERGGEDFEKIISKNKIINIDHHLTNKLFGELNLVDINASATGELIYRVLREIPAKITLPIALNIYTAILTDTGSFHYPNTTAKSLEIAGEMIKIGVDPWRVAEAVYENNSLAQLRLMGLALNTIEVSDGGMIGSMVVYKDMFRQTGTTSEDTEDFVNYLRSLSKIKVAVFLKEISEECFKLSLRSKGELDVAEIAGQFGGGGHQNAAGFTIRGDLTEIKEKVFRVIRKKLQDYNSYCGLPVI